MIALLAFQDPAKQAPPPQPFAGDDWMSQLPPAASTFASDVDGLFYFCLYISIFFFFLITGLLFYTTVKHRRRSDDQAPASTVTHNTSLEVVWTLIPTIILMVIFWWGWKGNLKQSIAPGNALQYQAEASMWVWNFTHPGATTASGKTLWVPVNRPVKITMHSKDVLHSLFIPAFRAKRDVLPGRKQVLWFEATKVGQFPIFCAEYCGDQHSQMHGIVNVVTPEVYAKKPWLGRPDDPAEWGAQLFVNKGCGACHDVANGVDGVGPTLKGLMGKPEDIVGGTITVDEAYLRESIVNPNAKIVRRFEGKAAMPPMPLDPAELDAIVLYISGLKEN